MSRRPTLVSVTYRFEPHDVEVGFYWPDETLTWPTYQTPFVCGYARLAQEVPLRPRALYIPVGSMAVTHCFLEALYGSEIGASVHSTEQVAQHCLRTNELGELATKVVLLEPTFTRIEQAMQAAWQFGHVGTSPYVRLACQGLTEDAFNGDENGDEAPPL